MYHLQMIFLKRFPVNCCCCTYCIWQWFIDLFIFFFKNIEIPDEMCKWFLRQFYVNNKFCEQTNLSCKTHSGGGGDQEGWSALPLFLFRILEGLSPHSLEGNISNPYTRSLGVLGIDVSFLLQKKGDVCRDILRTGKLSQRCLGSKLEVKNWFWSSG